MNRLTAEQRQFIERARAQIELAIRRRDEPASDAWIARLAAETGPIRVPQRRVLEATRLSPAQVDERMILQAMQSLYGSITTGPAVVGRK